MRFPCPRGIDRSVVSVASAAAEPPEEEEDITVCSGLGVLFADGYLSDSGDEADAVAAEVEVEVPPEAALAEVPPEVAALLHAFAPECATDPVAAAFAASHVEASTGYVRCDYGDFATLLRIGRITTYPWHQPLEKRSVGCKCYMHKDCSITRRRAKVSDAVLDVKH